MKITDTDSFREISGIYIIKCLVNGKYYIGESINIKQRLRKHKNGSGQLIHRAIKKYGIENFEIYIEYLPDFDKKSLLDLEEQLIIKFDCIVPKGYNIYQRGAELKSLSIEAKRALSERMSGENNPNFGKHHSEKSKRKISETHLGRKASDETRKKLSEMRRGEGNSFYGKTHSAETKEKLCNCRGGPRIFIDPNGEREEIFQLRKYANKHNLNYERLRKVKIGEEHKGWRRID